LLLNKTLYGSRSAVKKPLGLSTGANIMVGTPTARHGGTPFGRHAISTGKERRESRAPDVTPKNYMLHFQMMIQSPMSARLHMLMICCK